MTTDPPPDGAAPPPNDDPLRGDRPSLLRAMLAAACADAPNLPDQAVPDPAGAAEAILASVARRTADEAIEACPLPAAEDEKAAFAREFLATLADLTREASAIAAASPRENAERAAAEFLHAGLLPTLIARLRRLAANPIAENSVNLLAKLQRFEGWLADGSAAGPITEGAMVLALACSYAEAEATLRMAGYEPQPGRWGRPGGGA